MKFILLLAFSCALCAAPNLENSKEVIRALVDANYQKSSELAILQLFKVDEAFFSEISAEVFALIRDNNPSYVTDPNHLSYWSRPVGLITQFSLLNVSGVLNDYSTDHDRSIKNKQFAHKEKYPSLAKFISLFPHATNFRINILNAKSCFTQHQEDICFLNQTDHTPTMRVRFHLPIFTNSEAMMLMEGEIYHFEPGNIYFFHNGCIHDGVNMSADDSRIHLVWDMLLTEDTYLRMFQRSIDLPLIDKIPNTDLMPIGHIGIDPLYKRTSRTIPYHHALRSSFCPIQ